MKRLAAVLCCALCCTVICNLISPFARATVFGNPPRVSDQGLMATLDRTMRGQSVIAVADWRGSPTEETLSAAKADGPMVGRLQAVAASFSSVGSGNMIPFAVRGAWVIAPETREEARTDFTSLPELDTMQPRELFEWALTSLTRDQVKRLGSEEGVRLSDLAEAAREPMKHTFRGNLRVTTTHWRTEPGEDGTPQTVGYPGEPAVVEQPLDWTRIRLRARLRMNGVQVDAGPGQYASASFFLDRAEAPEIDEAPSPMAPIQTGQLPLLSVVPNIYKPSDLEGKKLTQPIGTSGILRVSDALAQVAKLTGLRLYAASGYRDLPVFLGSENLTCGEVLDGLRLALTASFRKLGSVYVLAWDKRGLGALQQLASEAARDIERGKSDRLSSISLSPNWETLAYNLPFAPDDPIALTDEQRRRLLDAPFDRFAGPEKMARVTFADMSPAQQDAIRSRLGRLKVHISGAHPSDPSTEREMTEQDLYRSYLVAAASAELEVDLPGHGWVRAPGYWGSLMLHPDRLESVRRVARGEPPYPDPPKAATDKPQGIRAATRALIVPALGPARVNELAGEMTRHGFNMLFYPALFDGYSTFPSKLFPLHPALREADGFKAAVAAMKKAGVRVVPYVSTLTWQAASDTAHWLTKHPDWIDVDIAGRTRLDWLQGRFAAKDLEHAAAGNVVRLSDPAVVAKLQGLLSELATRPGADAVAFADWNPAGAIGVDAIVPTVGFAVPDRLTEVLAGRDDPVDLAYPTLSGETVAPRALGASIDARKSPRGVRVEAMVDVLQRAKALRPGWTTWILDATKLMRTSPIDGFERTDPPYSYADKVVGMNPIAPGAPIQVDMRHATMAGELYFLGQNGGAAPREAIVFDFRACPEKITDALRQVPAPEDTARVPAS